MYSFKFSFINCNWNELNEIYKLTEKQDSDISEPPYENFDKNMKSVYNNRKFKRINRRETRSMNNFNQVLENINKNDNNNSSKNIKKEADLKNSSERYNQRMKNDNYDNLELEKYQIYRLKNLDRLEKQITGKSNILFDFDYFKPKYKNKGSENSSRNQSISQHEYPTDPINAHLSPNRPNNLQKIDSFHSVSSQVNIQNLLKKHIIRKGVSNKLTSIADLSYSCENRSPKQYPLPLEYMQMKLKKDIK